MTTERRNPLLGTVAVLLVTGVGAMLAWALVSLSDRQPGLSQLVREKLPASGVDAEVTAVLLNFRGYDTLLELAVLAAAALGVWRLDAISTGHRKPDSGGVLQALVRYLVALLVLVSGYVLWLGGHASGGAFQADALLAGAGVLLFVVQPQALALRDSPRLRTLVVFGPALFVLVAGGVMFTGSRLLEYPPQYAGVLILLIEAAATLSIGIILLLLFAGGRPDDGAGQ